MHLTKLLALFTASVAVAAPPIEYSQISVKVTNTAAQNHGRVVHSSQELQTNGGPPLSDLPFRFTLLASLEGQSDNLPFGFETHGISQGRLGPETVFAFQNGKVTVDNYLALGQHPARIYPPWTSLLPLDSDGPIFELVVVPKSSDGRGRYNLEFPNGKRFWGILAFEPGAPVTVIDSETPGQRITLEVLPLYLDEEVSNDADADSVRDVL